MYVWMLFSSLIEVLINHGADANYQNDAGKTWYVGRVERYSVVLL